MGIEITISYQFSWSAPSLFQEAAFESGMTELPSGGILAAIRHQRNRWPNEPHNDPPNIAELMRGGATDAGAKFPFKHVFLQNADYDGGTQTVTWDQDRFRQLTTARGQCYGDPVALSDGTVVLIHDTRYGPGENSGRAMISYDEGQTWKDEAYYVYYGAANSGYSESVVVEDGTILTIAGTQESGVVDLTAIRWKPVKE
jgi:hypothetical protein